MSTKAQKKVTATTKPVHRNDYAEVKAARTAARTANTAAVKSAKRARFLSAVAFHAAEVAGVVGKDTPLGSDFRTWTALAESIGTGKSNATALRRIGAMIADAGVTTDSDVWGILSDKSELVKGYVADGKVADPTGAVAHLRSFLRPDGSTDRDKVTAATDKRQAQTAGDGTAEQSGATPTPRSVSGLLDALETIRANMPATLTPAEGERLAAILDTFESLTVSREDDATSTRKAS